MRCERCKFENIPGQKTCIKCGSTLEIKPTAINVYPPRASSWKKPFRNLPRWIRRRKIAQQHSFKPHVPLWFKDIFSDSILGLFLSIIPGLAHLVKNRFREIRWHVLFWTILLISGLFLYGSSAGFICLGLAVGIHASIAVRYGIIKDLAHLREKIITVVLVLIALIFIYRYTPRVVVPNLTGGYSNMNIPYHRIEAGDYLLAWGGMDQETPLDRGSIVLIRPVTLISNPVIGNYGSRANTSKEKIIGQIVGLAEEQVEIQKGVFIVNGQPLDPEKYPVPQWLHNMNFSAKIPDNSYFVSAQYNVTAHGGIRLQASDVRQICLMKASDIEAEAFMRWWPLLKRGFIR